MEQIEHRIALIGPGRIAGRQIKVVCKGGIQGAAVKDGCLELCVWVGVPLGRSGEGAGPSGMGFGAPRQADRREIERSRNPSSHGAAAGRGRGTPS
jgi:hypothetical protein